MKFFKAGGSPDYQFLYLLIILTLFGLIILASASFALAKEKFNDNFFYLKRQILYGLIPGILGFLIAYFFPYEKYKKLALIFIIINIILLILVKFSPLGIKAGGSERWLALGPISFQPSELLKITYIIYIAAWISNVRANRINNFSKGFLPFLLISGVIGFLLYIEPATTLLVIVIGTGFALYFINGAKLKYLLILFSIAVLVGLWIYFEGGYRFNRIYAFLNPDKDIYGSGYHLNQSLITVGSGGLFGFGFGKSTTKYGILPEPIGDSIFAVAAQELGFVGAGTLIVLLLYFIFRIFYLSLKTKTRFGQLILIGFGLIIGIQSLVHILVAIGLAPTTGIPLPFVSYGGTSLAVFLTMSGIILNISKK
jgi:cell division protein FtsW